jgi:hypothetical protein
MLCDRNAGLGIVEKLSRTSAALRAIADAGAPIARALAVASVPPPPMISRNAPPRRGC